jgi:hypothetical protein
MIEWQEHSTPQMRAKMADELDLKTVAVHAAKRELAAAQAKLARQRSPASVDKATQSLIEASQRLSAAERAHDEAVRLMCRVHLDISLDDVVELVRVPSGERAREPIVVTHVEFNRNADGSFWVRIQGDLLAESESGRPQLTQGLDLKEHDASVRIIKHN